DGHIRKGLPLVGHFYPQGYRARRNRRRGQCRKSTAEQQEHSGQTCPKFLFHGSYRSFPFRLELQTSSTTRSATRTNATPNGISRCQWDWAAAAAAASCCWTSGV